MLVFMILFLKFRDEKMLKKYRIIPLVFNLFLLGLPLLPVSPVFAEDHTQSLYPRVPARMSNWKVMKRQGIHGMSYVALDFCKDQVVSK